MAINRSIGAIAVKPGDPSTIYIGTDVARHGSSSVNGGRRTPPEAPTLGVYTSTDSGAHFALAAALQARTPANPSPPGAGTGSDWFQGGITKLELDPNNTSTVYAAVVGYGLWRSTDGGSAWTQVFRTFNQNAFGTKAPGDTFGDRVEFDAVNLGAGKTRIYLGDSSDDLARSQVWRTDDAAAIAGDPTGAYSNAGWTELSSSANGTNGFLAFNYCQAQCGYDDFVTSPAAQLGVGPGHANTLWLGGSMNYDELPAYAGLPQRSNGRGVIRSTNGGALAPDVTWQDMSATMGSAPSYPFTKGIHPDQHAVVFNPVDPGIAFVGSDGGVVRIDVRNPAGQVGRLCDPEVRLHPRSARRPACAAGPDGLSAPAERDPTDDHADQRRPEHDPVPVALVQPEQPDRRAPGRDAGQRDVLLHRHADLVRIGRRRRRPVRLRRREPDDPVPQLLRRDA